jgi:alpha-N-arabinofuranosidase
MKAVDNNIQLVGSGSSYYEPSGKWVEWNNKVLAGIGDKINFLSIHRYWESSPDYYTHMGAAAMDFEEKIKLTAGQIASAKAMKGFKNPIYLAVDEWGSFGRNFINVLPIAQCLNSFLRHADVVKMANFTMLTSLLSSDQKNGTFRSPLFYTFKLFSNNCLGKVIDSYVECDTFSTALYQSIPYLDVTAVYSKENGAVFINVVNRHKDKTLTTSIVSVEGDFTGKAEASIIYSDDLQAAFTFENRELYKPVVKSVQVAGNKLSYSFPPHSFTQIKVNIAGK